MADKTDEYRALKAAENLACGTIKRALEIRARRDSRRVNTAVVPLSVEGRTVKIDLCESDAKYASRIARERYPRLKNWEYPSANLTSLFPVVLEVNNGRYSSRCTYTHWTYQPLYRSCGTCSPRRLLWFRGSTRAIILSPAGCRWGRDNLGIYVVRQGENRKEYRLHVTGDMLVAGRRAIKSELCAHEKRQRQVAARERQKARDARRLELLRKRVLRLGVMVGIRDSVASGNCAVGTKRWAEDHDLSATRYYPIDRIRALASRNGNASQINRACEAAIDRSIADLERGYCEL